MGSAKDTQVPKYTIIRHTSAQKSGHRHHTGGHPFDQTKYAQAELLAHIGRANGSLLTIDCIEQTLTQTNILGRNLDQFVVDDILQSLF